MTEYPESNISGVGLATFARLASERSCSQLAVEASFENRICSGGLVRAVADGGITGGDAFAGPMEAIEPLFGLPSLPFVVQSLAAARHLNGVARHAYEAALARRGMKLLYVTIWPSTGLWSDRKLVIPDDIRALAIRTYDYNSARVLQAADAKAEYLPFNDAIAKVKAGGLNAILTSGDGGAGRKLWDHLSHFTALNYAIPVSLAFVSLAAFDALPRHVRAQVLEAARETEESQVALLHTRTAENHRQMREHGVEISEPSREILSHLRMRARPIIAAWKQTVPDEIRRMVDGLE